MLEKLKISEIHRHGPWHQLAIAVIDRKSRSRILTSRAR